MSTPAYITDMAVFLPNAPVDNETIEQVLGKVGGRPSRARALILSRNGIQTRYYAIDPASGGYTHNNARMTAEAVRTVLHRGGMAAAQIDCLCCGTSSPDQIKPAHAHMVHGELAGPPCEVVSTAGVCTAGVMGLKYAWLSVTAGLARNAVSTGSEFASSFMHAGNFELETADKIAALGKQPALAFEKDFLRWMLSDGAGAALIRPAPNRDRPSLRIDWIDCLSFAGDLPVCMYSGAARDEDGRLRGWREASPDAVLAQGYFAVKQDVRLLDRHVVEVAVERALLPIAARRGLVADDVHWFLPHYSSEYFRPRLHEALARGGFPIPHERWFTNLSRKGNVGSAAIYLMLEELMYSGRLTPGDRLLCLVPESARFSVCVMHLTVV